MPDQTVLEVVQKYILLATGAPGSHALREDVIKLYEQTNDLSLVNERVDAFMTQQVQAHEKGFVGVVQDVARNGFGLNLSDEESQQLITDLAAQGINSWSQIFSFATTALNQDLAAILDNRSEAANVFTDLLAELDKDSDYHGAQTSNAAREWIAGIGASDTTLVAATDGAQDLVNSFVDGNVQGKAFDGYISGATVFIDTNQDGVLSPGELSTTTDALGNFLFEGDIPDGSLIATGGTDIATNQPFNGTLSGPQGTFVLSPLTTLVHQLLQNGQAENIVAAEDILFQSLGIPRIDLSSFDPIDIGLDPDASTEEQSTALQLQAITAQISNLLTVSSSLLSNVAGVTGDAMQSMAGSLREVLVTAAQNDQVVDLTDLLTIQNVIATGAANSGIAGNIEVPVSQVATVLAEINTITQQAAENSNSDTQTAFSDIVKFQTLVQAQVVPKAVAALETGDLSAVVTEFTDDTLVDNIDNVLLEGVLNAVTPESLNTLVDELLQNEQVADRLAAEDILFQSLDIPRVDLSNFDPIAVGLDPDTTTQDQSTALQLQAITAQILNVLSVSSTLIDNAAGTTGNAIQSVTSSLVETLISAAQNSQTVDLTEPQTLKDIITTAAANSGIVGDSDAPASQIATVLADINTVTQQAAENSNTNTQTAFSDIAKVQSLTQTQVIPAAEDALETGDLSEVVTEFTDDKLVENIEEVAITGTLNDSTPVDNGETKNPAPQPTTKPPTTTPPPPPPADTDAPTLDSSTPVDNATAVAVGDNIILTFNESVTDGTGNIVISDGSGDTRTIDVTDGTQVSFSGSSVTINPTADLNINAIYNVQMASGVIEDSSGNAFAGISDTTTLNFATPDTLNPTLVSSSPADDATAVSVSSNIVLTFSETVVAGTGNIVISNGGDTRTIDVTDGTQVSFSGNTVTINPTADLNANTIYNVQMASGVIEDNTGKAYAGINDATTLNINTTVQAELSTIELDSDNGGFVINGVAAGDLNGISVSSAGDVNNDGLDDLIVGASGDDPNGNDLSGASFVVFGKTNGTVVELSDVDAGNGGFTINGVGASDRAGVSVSGAGDVNGDGLADLIVGANRDDPNASDSGASFVVFGKANGTTVELSDIDAGTGGFVINGVSNSDFSGESVSSAGDVNGDGLADLIVGARYDDPNGQKSGASFVVFGKTSGVAVELSDIDAGNGGFTINGVSAEDQSGISVSDAGDVNGDGLADLIIGAHRDDPNGSYSGASSVVFGKTTGTTVELSDIDAGNGGFVINGVSASDSSGFSVSTAGDVNGDGLDDLIVGARFDGNGGVSFVVFGKANGTTVELSDIEAGNGGFAINGANNGDQSGWSVSNAGDVNGDGLADVIIGAYRADPNGNFSGASHIVFGKTNGTLVELSDVDNGNGGFVINGVSADDRSGDFVSSAGDVNGDGFTDLIVGAFLDDPNGASSGASFVVFGGQGSSATVGSSGNDTLTGDGNANQLVAGAGNDTLVGNGGADVLRGGSGNDILAVSDLTFASLDGGTGSDTLRFDAALSLDLRALADTKLNSIEKIDLTSDGGNSTLSLNILDVLNLNEAQTATNTLVINGSAGDTINLYDNSNGQTGTWADAGGGVYQFSVGGIGVIGTATIDAAVTVNII